MVCFLANSVSFCVDVLVFLHDFNGHRNEQDFCWVGQVIFVNKHLNGWGKWQASLAVNKSKHFLSRFISLGNTKPSLVKQYLVHPFSWLVALVDVI